MRPVVWFSVVSLFLVSACTIKPVKKPVAPDSAAWLSHQNTLKHVDNWQFSGRFAAKTDTENWTGGISWSQSMQEYQINISGPLSSGSISLEGTEDYSKLSVSDSEWYEDINPQLLLQHHTGLKLPIEELRYWLRGLPALNSAHKIIEFNEAGQLQKLQQNNWEISFKRYKNVGTISVPDKIFLLNHEINVRLIIQKWQIRS